jgi:hypothetical protein
MVSSEISPGPTRFDSVVSVRGVWSICLPALKTPNNNEITIEPFYLSKRAVRALNILKVPLKSSKFLEFEYSDDLIAAVPLLT